MNLEQYDEMKRRHEIDEHLRREDSNALFAGVSFLLVILALLGAMVDKQWNQGRVLNWIDGLAPVEAQSKQYPPAEKAPPALKYLPARGGQPDVLVILRDAPSTWALCAQRYDSDQMDCRPVDEARKWLRERPAVKR